MAIKKILVVDDISLYLNQITQILTDEGYQVISASSGTEAIEQAKQEQPDLIFMDIVMPNMDGFAACRAMTRNGDTKNIPIVFVSSKDQEADRVWAELQGAKAYITKPYTEEQILEQIEMFN